MIYLDMDGTISDLLLACSRLYDAPIRDCKSYLYKDIIGVDIDYSALPVDIWETLPKTPWADELVWLLSDSNVCVLTKMSGANSAIGKMLWLDNHYPQITNRILVSGDKCVVGSSDDVLIDDCEDYRNTWRGKFVLVPQNWNSLRGQHVLTSIKEQFSAL